MKILAFETSCDETSAAVIIDGVLRSNIISSQEFHTLYGGVVPELSSRAHIKTIIPILKKALSEANVVLSEIDYFAATAGPGLIGALMIGLTFSKAIAVSLGKSFVPVNHIEGHIFSGFLMPEKPVFPFLALVVSGGHSMIFFVESFVRMKLLGTTVDDAAGEAFDKVSKLLDLGYPGGPQIQRIAKLAKERIDFPVAELKNKYDLSFSGLKTSVLRYVQNEIKASGGLTEQMKADISAGFQTALVKALVQKSERAIKDHFPAAISVAGGVAANAALREEFNKLGEKYSLPVIIPSLEFCGDNAAMIAFRALSLIESGGQFGYDSDSFPSFSSKYLVE